MEDIEAINKLNKRQGVSLSKPLTEDQKWYNKAVIPPNNYWNMMWNNFVLIIFFWYCFVMPIMGSYTPFVTAQMRDSMMIFDVIFVIDRTLDLFTGYYQPNGDVEKNLIKVL